MSIENESFTNAWEKTFHHNQSISLWTIEREKYWLMLSQNIIHRNYESMKKREIISKLLNSR